MPQPEIRVEGIPELRRKLQELASQSPEMAGRAIRAGAAVLGEGMERRAPALSDEYEGTLGESIQMRPAGQLSVLVGTDHGLARVVEDGGEITVSRRSVLASEEQGIVFGRSVVLPARPFIRPAVDEDRGQAVRAVRRSAQGSLQRRRR
jgi:hypothetical protein